MPEVIDWPQLKKRCLDDDDFVREMVGVFQSHAPVVFAKLAQAIAAGDAVAAKKEAHTLKGSAASLAADPLRVAAYDVEMMAKAGDMAGVIASQPLVDAALQQCLAETERFLRHS